MSVPVEIKLPVLPDCWESCGNCTEEAMIVSEIFVSAGEPVQRDDPLFCLELEKTSLEIPSPYSGRVLEVKIEPDQKINQDDILFIMDISTQ
jgi:pyruvate/2-oxoglutarate dehydrogenase complex dihydrolipoamide acyltransferase (E2) component